MVVMSDFVRFRRAFRRAVTWHSARWDCFSKTVKRRIILYWY